MGPLFAAEVGKFFRQPPNLAMAFLVLPRILSRHAHECGNFFRCRLLFAQSPNLLLEPLNCSLDWFPFYV